MSGTERAKQRIILHYLDNAQKAERQRMEAIANRDSVRAALLVKVAAFWWTAAEYGPIMAAEITDGPGARHVCRRFLAAVTGDDSHITATDWATFRKFLMTAALDLLPTTDCMCALLYYVGGLDEWQIAYELWLPHSQVSKSLQAARAAWQRLVAGVSHRGNNTRRAAWRKVVDDGPLVRRQVIEALQVFGSLTTTELITLMRTEGDNPKRVRGRVVSALNWLKRSLRVLDEKVLCKRGELSDKVWRLASECLMTASA